MDKPTLVTITYNSWGVYTKRLIEMVEHFTSPDDISEWIFCDNNSDDACCLARHRFNLPTRRIFAEDNYGDLPRYNTLIPEFVKSDVAIIISTDCRIHSNTWVPEFVAPFEDDSVAMVGAVGPGKNMTPAHSDPAVGGSWHWIPQSLLDRGLEFDTCHHVQTHCFAIRTAAFDQVGGFWEAQHPEKGNKGHLIAAEIEFSVRLRRAKWNLSHGMPFVYHYGNGAKTRESLDEFDRAHNWRIDF